MSAELLKKGLDNASHTKVVKVGRGILASSGSIIREGLLEAEGRLGQPRDRQGTGLGSQSRTRWS